MKTVIFLIVLFTIAPNSLFPQEKKTQQQIRTERQFQLGVLPNFGEGYTSILYFGYSLNEKINLSGEAYIMNSSSSQYGVSRETISVIKSRQFTNKPAVSFTFDYFPHTSPFYIYAGLGSGQTSRGFEMIEILDLSDILENRNSGHLPESRRTTRYTITPKVSGHAIMGVGFKYLFESGFMINTQIGMKRSPNAELNIYVENDIRQFISGFTPDSPEKLLLKQATYKSIYSRYTFATDIHFVLIIGASF